MLPCVICAVDADEAALAVQRAAPAPQVAAEAADRMTLWVLLVSVSTPRSDWLEYLAGLSDLSSATGYTSTSCSGAGMHARL